MKAVPTQPAPAAPPSDLTNVTTLLREAGLSFWLNVGARAAHLLTAVVLARLLGVEGFGAFGWAMGWAVLMSTIGGLGFGQLLVREVSAYRTRTSWARLAGLVFWTDRNALYISGSLAVVAAGVAWVLRARVDPLMLAAFWASLPLVPLLVLVRLRQATVRGLLRLIPGQLAESAIFPGTFLILLVALAVLGWRPQPWLAMLLQVAAAGVACVYATRTLRRAFPREARGVEREVDAREWLGASLGLFFLTAAAVVNARADVLLVGALRGAEAVGLYNAAARGAELVSIPLLVAGVILAPRFGSLHAAGAVRDLRRLFGLAAGALMVSAAPLFAGLVMFRDFALGLFGSGFLAGGTALIILSLGQWLNAATGLAGVLMVMTGRERQAGLLVGGATLLNITLNVVLIPRWGIEGAAVATALSLAVMNGALLMVALRGTRSPHIGHGPP